MEPIAYAAVLKNKGRPCAQYYGRITQSGKQRFIPLHTKDKKEAELWAAAQRKLYRQIRELDESGIAVPPELLAKLLTVTSMPVLARKQGSKGLVSIGRVIDEWAADMALRNRSERTVTLYTKNVMLFFKASEPIDVVTVERLREIMASKAKLKSATRRSIAESLRGFCKFIEDRYGMPHELARSIPVIKAVNDPRTCWSREELQSILGFVDHPDPNIKKQYVAYFTLLCAVGCRQGEAASLRWEWYRNGCITFPAISTKGGKGRVVPCPHSVQRLLADMVEREGLMFPDLARVTQAARYAVWKKAVLAAGCRLGGLHDIRRSVATWLYRTSGNLQACAELLGHSPQVAMQHYLAAHRPEELRELVDLDLLGW